MTDNEIINALELCATLDSGNCKKCPCREICNENDGTLTKLTLDLINRQKAEINNLKAEIAEHKAMLEAFDNELVSLDKAIKTEKSEAIKEFAEKLKRKATVVHKTHSGKHWYEIDDDEIDNLVK